MTGEPTAGAADAPADEQRDRDGQTEHPLTIGTVLREVAWHLRRDPVLAVPFTAVGALLAAADYLRRVDPIAAAITGAGNGIDLEYPIFPRGTARTGRTLGGVVDLDFPYLLWAVGLEALVLAAVGLAGFATIAWTTDARVRDSPVALLRYVAVLAGMTVAFQALGRTEFEPGGMLAVLVAVIVLLQVLVRIALTPAFLVAGRGLAEAVRDSVAASRGIGWPLFGVVLTVGLAAAALGRVPVAGPYLSTAVVATVQSVALGVVAGHRGRSHSSR